MRHETICPTIVPTRLARTVHHLPPCPSHRSRTEHLLALPSVRDRCALRAVSGSPGPLLHRLCANGTRTRMRSSDATMSIDNRLILTLILAAVSAITVGCAAPGSSGSSAPPESSGTSVSLPAGDVPAAMLEQVVADAASGA